MKTLMVVLFSAACALAQLTDGPQVPQLLAAHGIKSAAEFLRVQRTFQNAVAAIPAATAEMDQAVLCARHRSSIPCVTDFDATIREFQAARFNLRKSYHQANDALDGIVLEIDVRSFATGKDKLNLSLEDGFAIARYLKAIRENLDRNLVIAERQWHRTWRHAEKIVIRRRR